MQLKVNVRVEEMALAVSISMGTGVQLPSSPVAKLCVVASGT